MSGNASGDEFGLERFHGVFFDEAAEHLESMEALLLGLDADAPDGEQLNAIFRAAHSIKGGAATFGFKDITDLTHEMETVFDRVRKAQMALSTGLVDAFLASGDLLKSMLAGRRDGGAAIPGTQVAAQCARLREFLEPTGAATPGTATHEIVFGPFDPAFPLESLPGVLADLKDFGRLEEIPCQGPDERRYRIHTEMSPSDLSDALAFMADPERVKVRIPVAPPANCAGDEAFGFFVDPSQLPANDPVARLARAVAAAALESKRAAASGGADATSIRVGVGKVDQLINLVGELVITQSMLAQAASGAGHGPHEALANGIAQLQRNTRDLQEAAMSIRMTPISSVFSRFPRVVRDVAAKLGKEADLQTIGEATELDRGLVERIVDPLTHLVRNCLDHGLEPPGERLQKGKARRGALTLRAYHQGGDIVIEVSDDGRGLQRGRILAKARERGMTVSDAMTDPEVWSLIFEAGFSTAEAVTDVSGRGVGMDVVRRNIAEMGGRVEVDSAPESGTRITIKLPLTLAILDGLSVRVGDETFVIALSSILESIQPSEGAMRSIAGGGRVVCVRGEYLPVIALAGIVGARGPARRTDPGILVVVEAQGSKVALQVDSLVGQHQVVIKSLEANYHRVAGISGATIMGDGRVAMIVDVAHVVGIPRGRLELAA